MTTPTKAEKDLYIENNNCRFVDIKINDDGKLELFNWCSIGLTVEPLTGKILDNMLRSDMSSQTGWNNYEVF